MPVDDRDERSSPSPEEKNAEPSPVGEAEEHPAEPSGDAPGRNVTWRRRVMYVALALAAAALLLVVLLFFLYRSGQVDRIIANQIIRTLASYGIRAEIESFRTRIAPREVELRGITLYDAQSGALLGRAERLMARVRIEDLYALNLRRNVNLEELTIEGLDAYVAFDAAGLSNFRNIRLPPPDPNRRILFSYSTAKINLLDGTIHYDNVAHKLAGEARNVRLSIEPDDLEAPLESRLNRVALSLSDSTFTYDGRSAGNISVDARGRVNQTRAEIQELIVRSPVTETRAVGVMDDWRALRYRLEITSSVDLTQLSDVLASGATLRGAGRAVGTIVGDGSTYRLDARAESDALAIDNVRLKGLSVTAQGGGDGATYEAQARAVAELLTAGDYQLNAVQLAGNVRGTGTDFRWLGELRAAAARGGDASIAGLILRDVDAEVSGGGDSIMASVGSASAADVHAADARASGLNASGVRVSTADGRTRVTASGARAANVTVAGARLDNVAASGVEAVSVGDATSVVVNRVSVGAVTAAGAKTGSISIAGVRLGINGGRVEGRADDFAVGTIALAEPEGRIEDVRVARPVFTVEPAGSYRVSADLSLGGGVLGQVKLGSARAALVATNTGVQLNDFNAELLGGRANGDVTISTARGGTSRVVADFADLNIGGLLTLATGRGDVLVAGQTTGTVDLSFPGTNVEAASGTLRAALKAETGDDSSGRTPLTGQIVLRADRGLFQLETANLSTGATELKASGQFSFARDSDLQINLASSNAAELRRLLGGSGLAPEIEEQLSALGVELGGKLAFNGTVTGPLSEPLINGRTSIDSVILQGRDLGALSAVLETTANEIRVRDGRLTERDGGGVQFAVTAPLEGDNNISIEATLERANAGNLVAALPGLSPALRANLGDLRSDLNGRINLTGFPGAMQGSADLRLGRGRIGGETFQEIAARANFAGSTITLENLDARFDAGRLTASGTLDTNTQAFNLKASGTGIQLSILEALAGAGAGALPRLSGAVNLTASAQGRITDPSSYQINFDAEGREVAINNRPAGVLTLTGRTENQKLTVTFVSGLLGQPQTITAQVDFANSALPTTIESSLINADLTPLFATLLPNTGVRITGRATGTLRAAGNLFTENADGEEVFSPTAGLRGVANFTELTVQVADTQLSAVSPLQVQFTPDEVVFERTQFTGPGTDVKIGGTAALSPAGRQNLTLNGRLNLRVLNGISPDIFVAGTTDVAMRVSGTYAAPLLSGTAAVSGASFSTILETDRIVVNNINGRVKFTSNAAQVESLVGTLGGGRVEVVSGGARLEGLRPVEYRAVVRARDVTFPLPQNITATADANIEIRGTEDGRLLDGTITLRRAEYTEDIDLADLVNRRREASLEQGTGGGTLSATTQLNLQVQGNDALVVRNNLADIVGSVNLRIRGTVEEPIISGRVSATRGTVIFRNDRYDLTRAFVDLPAQPGADPILSVQAESDISGYRVIVSLTGELSRLQAVVRSEPALPQADVVALITTGSLSRGEASLAQTGVGTATSLLADTIINAPVRRATDRLFGLNVFEIDPLLTGRGGASPTARLTVGRQINRNLSVTYSTDFSAKQNQVIALEYRLSDRLSFVAQYEQGSPENLRTRSNDFSFEIRFRKRF